MPAGRAERIEPLSCLRRRRLAQCIHFSVGMLGFLGGVGITVTCGYVILAPGFASSDFIMTTCQTMSHEFLKDKVLCECKRKLLNCADYLCLKLYVKVEHEMYKTDKKSKVYLMINHEDDLYIDVPVSVLNLYKY